MMSSIDSLWLRAANLRGPAFALALGGCARHGAPSFTLAGSFFPAWMFCTLIGLLAAAGARGTFIATGLSGALPYQLFVCSAIGIIVGLLVWLLWFGQ